MVDWYFLLLGFPAPLAHTRCWIGSPFTECRDTCPLADCHKYAFVLHSSDISQYLLYISTYKGYTT